MTISIDAMGGDHGPKVTVAAALQILKKYPKLKLILVGHQQQLAAELALYPAVDSEKLVIHHATEAISMDELPSKALVEKKDSSMRVALNLVKIGTAQACVSAGNTGALMAVARYVLKTLPGIKRPAIIVQFPSLLSKHGTYVLDLGANVDLNANYLYQFAVMGSVLVQVMDNITRPKIALLNIGVEENKGNEQIKLAAKLLSEDKKLNYVGYIEADEILKGNVDVVVCDGFVGNVMLKTIEGVLKVAGNYIKRQIKKNFWGHLIGLCALPLLTSLKKQFDPQRHNGATFIGLRGVVIKSHGGANAAAFANAIEKAIIEVEKKVPEKIGEKLHQVFDQLVSNS